MEIQVNFGGVKSSDSVTNYAITEARAALERFAERVTRVEIHLKDMNGPKAGIDSRCTIEVRLAGLQPMAVDHTAADFHQAIDGAAQKLQRAVEHRLDRLRETHQTKP